ncbi:voltage-gated hydrogen channel 1 isoform 1-T1 [Alca torda]
MSRYLKHFTVVGDDPVQWSNDYQKWEEEEEAGENGEKQSDSEMKLAPTRSRVSFQDMMKKLFSSHRFQILVVCLVILDALLVLGELLMDLKIIHPDKYNITPKVFHYLSLSILTIFLVEVGFKVFVYRREFFHHKFEVLDGVVVVVSFILDIVLIFREHEFEAVGLLILLRLWRVARIINGRCVWPVGSFPLCVGWICRSHLNYLGSHLCSLLKAICETLRSRFPAKSKSFARAAFSAGAWP